jgi:hypothetical protein
MITLGEVKVFIATQTAMLNDRGDFVDMLVTEGDLVNIINMVYRKLVLTFSSKFPEHYMVTAYDNLVSGQHKYTLEGNITDLIVIDYVGMKYKSTDTSYTRCKPSTFKKLFPNNTDVTSYGQGTARYYKETQKSIKPVKLIKSLGIVPVPTENITSGLMVKYIEMPDRIADDADEFYSIPLSAIDLLGEMAIPYVWGAKQDFVRRDKATTIAEKAEIRFFSDYQPDASDEPIVTELSRSFIPSYRPY